MVIRIVRFFNSISQNKNFSGLLIRQFGKKKQGRNEESVQIEFDIEKVKREMESSMKAFENNLQRISIGRGDPRIFDQIYVQSKHTTLSSIAQIIPKNANEITIKPFDPKDIEDTLTALNMSEIKINARKEGTEVISVSIPKPTQEFRNELIKQAKEFCEDTKQNIRKKRQASLQNLKDAKEIGEDEIKRIKQEIQKLTDKYTELAEKTLKDKEKALSQ
jgi:ribosome recycling factor